MRFRVIQLEERPAALNMGIDEAVMEAVHSSESLPTIRFYMWQPSAVTIGRFQSMGIEVNVEMCKELGIDCVRRITGGGAVYHDSKGEITYSIIAPESYFPKGIRESYREICAKVVAGLSNLGISSEFVPINDIIVSGRKISGNAQTRKGGILLQHGTVLYDLNIERMFSVLKISKEKISDKMIKSVEERVTSVKRNVDVPIEDFYRALLKGFTSGIDYELGTLSEKETERASELARTVYGTSEWNFSR